MKNKGIWLLCFYAVISLTACDVFVEGSILQPFSQRWGAEMEYDDSGATKSLNVAAVCFDIDLSPEINRNKIVAFIDKIKAEQPNVRLILFSETTLGYYFRSSNSSGYQKTVAETVPGPTSSILSAKAVEHQIYISFGLVEKSGENLYNSQVLLAPDGTIASVAHKNHLTPEDKKNGISMGKNITVNVIDNIKVATAICSDLENVEFNKKLNESGAELVLRPAAFTDSVFMDYMMPQQFTYTWVLTSDRTGNEDGTDYHGMLSLTAPGGEHRIIKRRTEGYIYGVVKCY